MERLTRRMCGGWGVTEGCELNTVQGMRRVVERLAAYENTELTPEEITALQASNEEIKKEAMPLVQAKIEDRLVILPCKVKDTVYIIEDVFKKKKQIGAKVVSAQIDHMTIGGTGKPVFDICTETGNWYYSMEPEDFYMTREDAEAELGIQEG